MGVGGARCVEARGAGAAGVLGKNPWLARCARKESLTRAPRVPKSVFLTRRRGAQAQLASLTTPERKSFESVKLQMWREEQDFDAR